MAPPWTSNFSNRRCPTQIPTGNLEQRSLSYVGGISCRSLLSQLFLMPEWRTVVDLWSLIFRNYARWERSRKREGKHLSSLTVHKRSPGESGGNLILIYGERKIRHEWMRSYDRRIRSDLFRTLHSEIILGQVLWWTTRDFKGYIEGWMRTERHAPFLVSCILEPHHRFHVQRSTHHSEREELDGWMPKRDH